MRFIKVTKYNNLAKKKSWCTHCGRASGVSENDINCRENFASFFLDLSQRKKRFEIKPPLFATKYKNLAKISSKLCLSLKIYEYTIALCMTWNRILFVNRNQSVFRLINTFLCHMNILHQSLSILNAYQGFLCVKMQRFIFLVHLIEHKIYGEPTIVFVILVTNIIEKGPFTCICAGYIFQLYMVSHIFWYPVWQT